MYGEVGLHSLGDPLFFILFIVTCMFVFICTYIGYFCGKGIEKGIDYVKGNSDQDRRKDRSDDQSSPSVGFTEKVQSGRRFGDRQNRRNALHSGGKGGSKAQAR